MSVKDSKNAGEVKRATELLLKLHQNVDLLTDHKAPGDPDDYRRYVEKLAVAMQSMCTALAGMLHGIK